MSNSKAYETTTVIFGKNFNLVKELESSGFLITKPENIKCIDLNAIFEKIWNSSKAEAEKEHTRQFYSTKDKPWTKEREEKFFFPEIEVDCDKIVINNANSVGENARLAIGLLGILFKDSGIEYTERFQVETADNKVLESFVEGSVQLGHEQIRKCTYSVK